MAKKTPTLNLPSANDLFSTQEERDDLKREKVIDIALSDIDAFPEHPFKVEQGEALQAIVDSIKSVGVQTPAVVRLKENGRYEMISGHRRKLACELAGLNVIPCIVREMDQDDAIIAMVDSNLQRELILPSEKAKSYKMKLEALKRQGQRTDLTSRPLGEKLSVSQVSENSSDSARQIHRYIRLTELIPQLLDMVDDNKLAFRSAVEISYLTHEQQKTLFEVIKSDGRIPSHAQAVELRKLSVDDSLSKELISSIICDGKPDKVEHFKLPKEKIRQYFPANTSPKVIEDIIFQALELWKNRDK